MPGKKSGKGPKVRKAKSKGPKMNKKKVKSSKKEKNMNNNNVSGNKKPVTVTCLKCKLKIKLTDYTTKKTKNGAMLVQGVCNRNCMTLDNKPVKVAGFTKYSPEYAK